MAELDGVIEPRGIVDEHGQRLSIGHVAQDLEQRGMEHERSDIET